MSPRCQPRSSGTRRINTHQNTKKVKLLSAMNTTCMTNAPRRIIVALRLVARSAHRKRKLFEYRVTRHLDGLVACVAVDGSATVERQRGYGAATHPPQGERRRRRPDREAARKDARTGAIAGQDKGCRA